MDDLGHGVVKADGEPKVQCVGLAVRGLCGIMALGIGGMAIGVMASNDAAIPSAWIACLVALAVAIGFGLLAAFGVKVPAIDPAVSARFLELADPTRPLPDSVFRLPSDGEDAPGRTGGTGPEIEPRV